MQVCYACFTNRIKTVFIESSSPTPNDRRQCCQSAPPRLARRFFPDRANSLDSSAKWLNSTRPDKPLNVASHPRIVNELLEND